MYFPSL